MYLHIDRGKNVVVSHLRICRGQVQSSSLELFYFLARLLACMMNVTVKTLCYDHCGSKLVVVVEKLTFQEVFNGSKVYGLLLHT